MKELAPLPSTIAVAVSGGCDSMALVILAREWAKKNKHQIIALTVDHAIRKEAAQEANRVGKWLKKLRIKHHILTNKDKKIPKSNVQEYARDVRYKLMTEWCKKNKVHALLVAHHAEDQIETFLLRLERGSGVDGLGAMRPSTKRNGIRILRPLLTVSKQELQKFLKASKQKWIEDPSNENLSYKRNRLRKALGQASEDNKLLNKRLLGVAENMRRASDALDFFTEDYIKKSSQVSDKSAEIDIRSFSQLPEEIGLRVLKRLLCMVGGKYSNTRFEELERLYKSIKGTSTFSGCTLWTCKINKVKNGKILIIPEFSGAKKRKAA